MATDLQFLFGLTSVIALLQAVPFLVLATKDRRHRTLAYWGAGLLCVGLGNGGLALRYILPDALSSVLANTLLAASYVPFHATVLKLRVEPVPKFDAFGWCVAAGVAVALTWFTFYVPNLATRVFAIQLAAAILSARIAMDFTTHSRSSAGTLPCHIMASLTWFLCIMSSVTAIMVGAQGEITQDLYQAGPPAKVFMAVAPLLALVMPLIMLWIHFEARRSIRANKWLQHQAAAEAGLQAFLERCDAALAASDAPLSVLVLDMDNFKKLSKTHGFDASRQLLDWIARLVRQNLREGDSVEKCGVDQYAVLMPNTHISTGLLVAESIRREVEMGSCKIRDRTLRATVSIGVAMQSPERATGRALFSAAKLAIDSARVKGRNRVEGAIEGMHRFGVI